MGVVVVVVDVVVVVVVVVGSTKMVKWVTIDAEINI